MPNYNADSPLSITASIAGILTFVVAILAALYVRFTYLRNADSEYFQVKTSLSWYKTESTFMSDLISTTDLSLSPSSTFDHHHHDSGFGTGTDAHSRSPDADAPPSRRHGNEFAGRAKQKEKEMYAFVLEQLGQLEERLLECLAEAEAGVDPLAPGEEAKGQENGWTIIPSRMRGRTDIAVRWLPVRAKALELVRQRDALGSRVLFAQLSLISSRVRDQESRSRAREAQQQERLERLENMVLAQHEKLDRLEDLVYRSMHRDRVEVAGNEQGRRTAPLRRSETERTLRGEEGEDGGDLGVGDGNEEELRKLGRGRGA